MEARSALRKFWIARHFWTSSQLSCGCAPDNRQIQIKSLKQAMGFCQVAQERHAFGQDLLAVFGDGAPDGEGFGDFARECYETFDNELAFEICFGERALDIIPVNGAGAGNTAITFTHVDVGAAAGRAVKCDA
jgi:hypothetical protein